MILLALLQVSTAAAADPLAPARQGKLQCTLPDPVKKSCMAISRYEPDGERSYLNITQSLISGEPNMMLEFKSPTVIEGDAACGIMDRREMDEAILTASGAPVPSALRKQITDSIIAQVEADLGKKACTRIRREGGVLLQYLEMNGEPRPQHTMRVSLIDPAEGYRLRIGSEPD